jgi:hypothetical protein
VALTTVPAVAFAGRVTTVATSASGATVTVTEPVLFVGVLSGVVLVTLAVLVYTSAALPVLLMLTTMVSVAVAPLARLATVALTLLPALVALTPSPLTLKTFSPAGTTSLTVTLAAVLGPALTTTIAKLMVELAVLPLGWLATLLRLRSALALTASAAVPMLLVGVLSAVVVVTVLVAVTLLTGMVKVKVSWIDAPGARLSVVVFAPLVLIAPPAVPTTTLPVTLAAVLVPLLL